LNEGLEASGERGIGHDAGSDVGSVLQVLEHRLAEAAQATRLLAQLLQRLAPAAPGEPPGQASGQPVARQANSVASRPGTAAPDVFERLWDRMERERNEKLAPSPAEEKRGLDLLPQSYLITVEDRRGKVNMVPLHRALLSLPGVRDASLVSYANGVPIVSIQSEGEVDLEQLANAVSKAMARQCEVIPQDNNKLYLRLAS